MYALASLVTVLLGTAMMGLGDVGEQRSMGQAWVSASYGAYAGRISAAGGVAALAFMAIIVLMVVKPGA